MADRNEQGRFIIGHQTVGDVGPPKGTRIGGLPCVLTATG